MLTWLFDEAEALAEAAPKAGGDTAQLPPAPEGSADTPAGIDNKKAPGKRKPLPVELPRIDVVHDLPVSLTATIEPPMIGI